MKRTHKITVIAGTTQVAEEVLSAIRTFYGEYFIGTARRFADSFDSGEAELFICFNSRLSELRERVAPEKLLGIDMVPTPEFTLELARIPKEETVRVFCNSRKSAQVIIDYCVSLGLTDRIFKFATSDYTDPAELAAVLQQARCILGVSTLVGEGGLLRAKYAEHLNSDCRIIPVKRILSTASLAALNRWILDINMALEREVEKKSTGLEKALALARHEVQERKTIQERLEYEISHDYLTGLHNRRYFHEVLEQIDERRESGIGLMIMDLDGLKSINDRFGHQEGDKTLIAAARIFRSLLPSRAVVARVGGDEFGVVLKGASLSRLAALAGKIERSFQAWREEGLHPVGISIGYSASGETYVQSKIQYMEADLAMYSDKERRKTGAKRIE